MLNTDSPYYQLLENHLQSFPDAISQWSNTPSSQNPNHPESLQHKTLAGHLVRSKSEVIIANSLFTNHIPYRYECALSLDDITIYPDFTIMHPKSLQLYYWEHLGMMDNTSYCDHALQKLKLYISHGYMPTDNLITTYESSNHPINSSKVQQIIYWYFM